jgi:predicted extracellular nuclease
VFEPTEDAIDFFETLESMRVRIDEPAVVGPTSRYGEIAVLADRGSGVAPRTAHGGVATRPKTPHAARILIDDLILGRPAMLRVGDVISGDVVGVLDYSYSNFKLINTEALPTTEFGSTALEMTELRPERSRLTVATFNVENLTVGSEDVKFARLGRMIARQMRSPDIVALQEIQDDSGPDDDQTVAASATLDALVDAVVERGGPRYIWRQIDPADGDDGGQPGANIRVAFLCNPGRVEFVDRGRAGPRTSIRFGMDASISHSPGRIAPTHSAFDGDDAKRYDPARKPLVGEFLFDGRRLIIVNLHLRSKRGDDPMFGRRQPPRRPSEGQRREQVQLVVKFVNQLLARDSRAAVVVLGDLNDFEFRRPIRELAAGPLENLMERLPVADRYTYVYQGASQTLDHILASPWLAARAEIDAVHVNADFPISERSSDHDPVVARFTFDK